MRNSLCFLLRSGRLCLQMCPLLASRAPKEKQELQELLQGQDAREVMIMASRNYGIF